MIRAKTNRTIVAVLALTLCASTTSVATAAAPPDLSPPPATAGSSTTTLITGDQVITHDNGTATVRPGPGREKVLFSITRRDDRLVVIPSDAASLVASGALDKRLFDVTTLREFGYDDAQRPDLPLIVSQAEGHTLSAPTGSTITNNLPSINGSALSSTKSELGAFWNSVTTNAQGSRALNASVEHIWLDGKRKASLDRSAAQIGAPEAWNNDVTGEGVTVAVLDTGVDQTHPDLTDRETAQKNFTDAPNNSDVAGHGTHVAGTVAGTGTFSQGKYRGIAHGAHILDGKILDDEGFGQDSWIIAGMQWAADQKADIANLSLGGRDEPGVDPLEEAVNTLSANTDTLFVIAAGNSGPFHEMINTPGSADAALTVGAVDRKDDVAEFSSRGPRVGDGALKPDITAPGTGIVAALHSAGTVGEPIDGRYTALTGTSMATPHVAGAAALLAQAQPGLAGEQLKAALTSSAKFNPNWGVLDQGSGRVDVPSALAQDVFSTPTKFELGTQLWPHHDDEPITKALKYHNSGDQDVTLDITVEGTGPDGKPAPEGMFTVDKPQITVPAKGDAEVAVTTNTNIDAPDGDYTGKVIAAGGEKRVTTPVTVEKEIESYDVTVNHIGFDGKPASESITSIYREGESDRQEFPLNEATSTLRLPKGEYSLQSTLYTSGEPSRAGLLFQPRLNVNKKAKLDLDFRTTKPVKITPPEASAKPVLGNVGYEDVQANVSMDVQGTDINMFSIAQIGEGLPPDRMVTRINSMFSGKRGDYHLAWFEPGDVPNGFERNVKQGDLATVHASYGTALENHTGERTAIASQADGPSSAEESTPVELPSSGRDAFFTTEGVEWTQSFSQVGPDSSSKVTQKSPPQRYEAGGEYKARFNYAPLSPGLPATDGPGWVRRSQNTLIADLPLFSDRAGNAGEWKTATGHTTLHRGEEVVGKSDEAGFGNFDLPPESGRYRLSTEANQTDSDISNKVTASWTFDSAHSEDTVALPLSVVRFEPELDDSNSAPAGTRQEVPLFLQGANGKPIPAKELTVQVSYDEGKTWTDTPVTDNKIVLDYPADATSVSLRANASDAQGNTVEHTVIRAYKLTP